MLTHSSKVAIISCLYFRFFHVSECVFFLLLVSFSSIVDPLYYVFFSSYRTITSQPKSISFPGKVKATQTRGYFGANQSRMAVSRTAMILPDMKSAEKLNSPTSRTVTQVIFFRILSLFENDVMKNLMEMLRVENILL